MDAVGQIVIGVFIAVATAYAALMRFYDEKWWEKKLHYFLSQTDAAYLLHRSIKYWSDKGQYLSDASLHPEFIMLNGQEEAELQKQFICSLAELDKFSYMGSLLTSEKSTKIIKRFQVSYRGVAKRLIANDKDKDALASGLDFSLTLLNELVEEAKEELKIKNGKRLAFFERFKG
ncbi:hypothetical protein [Pantoea vagans]|uniref:DUF4760 domain-containing protein n=1 Tax=Pantoea vagans TaxID=470934 RepID=A0AAN1NQ97_9GAMM|nr:hypothetical protein [Pantoea vagans]AVV37339.1 hypothetical protein C9381_09140 [Pantoea vagans]